MKTAKLRAAFCGFLLATLSACAQPILFQNLDFESGNFLNPTGIANEVPIA
jgi:hypothetical protein